MGLIAIASLAGEDWCNRAKEASTRLSGGDVVDDSYGVQVLEDLLGAFKQTDEDFISTREFLEKLIALEDRPWGEYSKQGKPISLNQMARLLRPFGIRSKTKRIERQTLKVYEYSRCIDAFERYLRGSAKQPKQP